MRLIDQPYRMGWHGEELYIVVHAPLEGQDPAETRSLTNITRLLRRKLIDFLVAYGARVRLVCVDAPFALLLRHNQARPDPVPENVITRMLEKFELPDPTEAHEVTYAVAPGPTPGPASGSGSVIRATRTLARRIGAIERNSRFAARSSISFWKWSG